MSFERAEWPDVPAAIRAFRSGGAVRFQLAIMRYLAAPDPAHTGMSALDCCTGSGQGALILRDKGWRVSAFDRFPGAANMLRARGVAFTRSDIYTYRPRRQVDMITACDCLEHLEGPETALRLFREWIAPDGRLWLAVPLEQSYEQHRSEYHVQAWTRQCLLALIARAGWTVEKETKGPPNSSLFWGLLK